MKISQMSCNDVLSRMGDCTVDDAKRMLELLRDRYHDSNVGDIIDDAWWSMCAEACKGGGDL